MTHGKTAIPTRSILRLPAALLATVLTLTACGGGGSGGGSAPADTALNESSCTFQYTLTALPVLSGADPLLPQQWHLANQGQLGGTPGEDTRATVAWTLTKGEGARVAIVDDAVETLHEDLRPNVVAGGSFNYRTARRGNDYPLPCSGDDTHGTAVAGLVAARDGNAVGGAGVAPRAPFVTFNALYYGTDADIADALSRDTTVNWVYTNSWGSPDDGALHPSTASFRTAIASGLANGRAGKGAVYVFAGGNGGCISGDASSGTCVGGYDDNSNFDGYVNGFGLITACATTDHGTRPWYGEPGANLLVCAPSSNLVGNVTTTAVGNKYESDFSGTSASTPMVAGAAALVLSANPALTWRDVRLILAQTARKNDPGNAGWSSAFGFNFNHLYGFGVVDASAAVTAARSWTSVGGSSAMVSCGPYASSPNLLIPDRTSGQANEPVKPGQVTPLNDSITVPSTCGISRLEFVEIRFTAAHSYSGDLQVRLTSPNGLVSELANARVCSRRASATSAPTAIQCGDYDNWAFGSNRHMGEPAPGTWTMQVTDMASGDAGGRWLNWTLTFWGR